MRFILIILALTLSVACFAADEKTTPGADKALAKYNDTMAKAKAVLAADLDKEIAAVMKSGKADALDVATMLKKKKDELCPIGETGDLESLVLGKQWLYTWNKGTSSKVMTLKPKGVITDGIHKNENSWRLDGEKLQILNEDKKPFTTFIWNKETKQWDATYCQEPETLPRALIPINGP